MKKSPHWGEAAAVSHGELGSGRGAPWPTPPGWFARWATSAAAWATMTDVASPAVLLCSGDGVMAVGGDIEEVEEEEGLQPLGDGRLAPRT